LEIRNQQRELWPLFAPRSRDERRDPALRDPVGVKGQSRRAGLLPGLKPPDLAAVPRAWNRQAAHESFAHKSVMEMTDFGRCLKLDEVWRGGRSKRSAAAPKGNDRTCAKSLSVRCSAKTHPRFSSRVGVPRTGDRHSKKHFRAGNVARNARFLIVAVGSPDVVGRLRACRHRTNRQ